MDSKTECCELTSYYQFYRLVKLNKNAANEHMSVNGYEVTMERQKSSQKLTPSQRTVRETDPVQCQVLQ